MTPLAEKVTKIGDLMKTMKIEWVAQREQHHSTDLAIYVHVYRNKVMVAALQCPLNRDTALQACQMAAQGMAADDLVITFESWHSNLEKSPITQEDWQPGEMAYVGQTMPEAIKERWVTECLTTMGYDRFGNHALISVAYLIDGTEVSFEDAEVYESDNEFKGAGYMHDVMTQIMQLPTILDEVANQGDARATVFKMLSSMMDDTHREFHMDCAALKAMAERELIDSAVLIAEDNPERQEMIVERFGDPD